MSEPIDWQAHYFSYGYDDYVRSTDGIFPHDALRAGTLGGIAQETAEQWYTDGWNTAMHTEQEQGRVVFLCNELLKRMSAGEEWYGTSFDDPMVIVNKIKSTATSMSDAENTIQDVLHWIIVDEVYENTHLNDIVLDLYQKHIWSLSDSRMKEMKCPVFEPNILIDYVEFRYETVAYCVEHLCKISDIARWRREIE